MDNTKATYRHDIVKLILKRHKYYQNGGPNGEKIEDVKLVFIGDVPSHIRRILYKLEINGGDMSELSKDEKHELNTTFPYFATKVGLGDKGNNGGDFRDGLDDYMLKFIYMTIGEDTPVENFQLLCLDILHELGLGKEIGDGALMCYSYMREIQIKWLSEVIEYVYFCVLDVVSQAHDGIGGEKRTDNILTGKQIADALWKLCGLGKPSQKANDIGLSSDELYNRDDLISNPDIQKLVMDLPISYNLHRYLDFNEVSNLYYMHKSIYEDIERLGANIIQIKQFNRFPKIRRIDNDYMFKYYQYTRNNTMYMELGTDIKYWIKEEKGNLPTYRQLYEGLYNYKIPITDINTVNRNRIYLSLVQNNGILNAESRKSLSKFAGKQREYITENNALITRNIGYGNVMYDCFYPHQSHNINLLHMFKEIETNTYLPVAKYISHGETQYYNIYRPFLRNMDDKTRALFLTGRDYDTALENGIKRVYDDVDIRYLLRKDYIILKWNISSGAVLNIYLFQNTYIICEYQFPKIVSYKELENFNNLLVKTVKRVRTFFKIRNISVPNPTKLYHPTTGIFNTCQLLTLNTTFTLEIDTKMMYIWYIHNMMSKAGGGDISREDFDKQNLASKVVYPELVSRGLIKYVLDKLTMAPSIWTLDTVNDEIRFVYKNTFKFFNSVNARNFIQYMILQNNKKLTPKEKTTILRRVCNIFNFSKEYAEEIYNSIDLDNINVTEHLIYHTNGHLFINKKTNLITLSMRDALSYVTSQQIIAMVGNIIKDFMFDTKFYNVLPIASVGTSGGTGKGKQDTVILKSRDELSPLTSILSSTVLDMPTTATDTKYTKDTIGTQEQALINIDKHSGLLPDFLADGESAGDMDGALLDLIDIDLGGLDESEQLAALEAALGDPELGPHPSDPAYNNNGIGGIGGDDYGKDVVKSDSLKVKDIKLNPDIGAGTGTRAVNKKGININSYMMDMYNRFDPKLFNPYVKGGKTDYKYGRSDCPDYTGRRPMIVSKEQLDDIDPESITGYMLYRGNYYICPRIWDAKANRPISVKSFIANGLRSPYTGGKAILEASSRTSRKYITDEYNVIVRKPSTDRYWSQPELHPEWPELLRHTEKEAFPGLTFSNKHPEKRCVPCCFLNIPDDYDDNKRNILRRFDRPYNYSKCEYNIKDHNGPPGEEGTKNKRVGTRGVIDVYCNNDEYISGSTSRLKNCRLGLLPSGLNALLNNGQSLFLKPSGNMILEHANLFLRRGITENPATNIIDTFANIMEKPTESVINTIVNKLTPVDFITMYNGDLVDMFCSSEELPVVADNNETGVGSIHKLVKFLEIYPMLIEYFAADLGQIIDYISEKRWLRGSAQERVDTIIRDGGSRQVLEPELLSLTKLLYKIMTAFYNYISYLASPKEVKSAEYVIELFSQPRAWPGFSKQGLNIIIFDSSINSIKCLNTFNYNSNKMIILIQEAPSYYVPVFHVVNTHGKMSSSGIIKLNNSVNLDNLILGVISRKNPTQIKHINSIKDRLTPLVRLLYIQSELCNYNITYFTNRLQRKFNTLAPIHPVTPTKATVNNENDKNSLIHTDTNTTGTGDNRSDIGGNAILSQYTDVGGSAQIAYVQLQITNEHTIKHDTDNDTSNKNTSDKDTKDNNSKSNDAKDKDSSIERLVLPVYPRYFIKHIPAFNYYRMHEDVNKIGMTIYYLLSALYDISYQSVGKGKNIGGISMSRKWETLYTLDYHVENIFIEPVADINVSGSGVRKIMITAVQFYNGLTMPLLPVVFDKKKIEAIQDYIYKVYNVKINIKHQIIPNLLKDTTIVALSKHLESVSSASASDKNTKKIYMKNELNNAIIKEEFFQDVINGMNLLVHIVKSNLSTYIYRNRGDNGKEKDLIKYLIESKKYIQDDKIYELLDSLFRKHIIKPDASITMSQFINKVYGISDWQNTSRLRITGNHHKTRKIVSAQCVRDTTRTISHKPHNRNQKGKSRAQRGNGYHTIKSNVETNMIDSSNSGYNTTSLDGIIYGSGNYNSNTINRDMNGGGKDDEIDLCVKDSSKKGNGFIRVPAHVYMWVLYNVGRDLVYDKTQMDLVITGKYIIPMGDNPLTKTMKNVYNASDKVGLKGMDDTVILTQDELAEYILSRNISKYRRNYKIKNRRVTETTSQKVYKDGLGRTIHLSDDDIRHTADLVIDRVEDRVLSGLSSVFLDISSIAASENNRRVIKTTVFNSEGVYNPMAQSSMCTFPYRTRTGGLSYTCSPARDVMTADKVKEQGLASDELICPTSIKKNKKLNKWGYCPEDPDVSMSRMTTRNTRAIDAYKYVNKNMPKRVGYCEFPFIYYDSNKTNPIVNPGDRSSPLIKIAFDCVKNDDGVPDSGSWCYVKSDSKKSLDKNLVPELFIGTKRKKNIYYGKWSMDSIYKNKSISGVSSITQRAITNIHDKMGLKKADCNIKDNPVMRNKIERGLGLNNVTHIKFDDYMPDKCTLSESKKGYTKKQLYIFGRDELNINYNLMLNKNNRIINKAELCKMFNRKIREIRKGEKINKVVASANKRNIYNKDPEKCLLGPSKGGYGLSELRDMAITHFGLSESQALQMGKSHLCDFIIPQLENGMDSDDINNNSDTTSTYNTTMPTHTVKGNALEGLMIEEGDLYPRDKNLDNCANSRGRGGLSKKQVVAVAARLKIDLEGHNKAELCGLIKEKIQQYRDSGYNPDDKRKKINSPDDIKADILKEILAESTHNDTSDSGSNSGDASKSTLSMNSDKHPGKHTISDLDSIDTITF